MTLEMVQASQIGMKAIGAAIAVGLTGIAAGIGRNGDWFCSSRCNRRKQRCVRACPAAYRHSGNYRHFRACCGIAALILNTGQTMGLEAVVEEIREKGRTEAEKIRAESKQETDKILAAAGKRVGEIKLAAEAESAKQTAHIIDQEVSAANLLVKRELLNTQKALLDKVYETTLLEIARSP